MTEAARDAPDGPRAGGGIPRHVCVVARSCHPDKGSEPGKSWAWIRALSGRGFRLTVVTEDFEDTGRRVREEAARTERLREVRWVFVPYRSEWLVRRFPVNRLAYRWWHRDVRRRVEPLVEGHGSDAREGGAPPVDLVHLLSTMDFRSRGQLWRLDVPYVWGPIGGAAPFPLAAFRPALGVRGRLYYRLFNLWNRWRFRRSPGLRRALEKARVVSATGDMQRRLRAEHGVESRRIPDVGVECLARPERDYRADPLRVAWSGLHIPRKGLPVLIEAVARMPPGLRARLRVEVLGDGPRRGAWERRTRRRGVADAFRFHGWLPREEAVERMAVCHMLCVTSLRDATSTVLVEAMGQGLPVAALDHCGFGDALGDAEAYRVDPSGWESAVDGFRRALEDAVENRDRLSRMGRSVRERARTLTYRRLADRMLGVYREAVGEWDSSGAVGGPGSGRGGRP